MKHKVAAKERKAYGSPRGIIAAMNFKASSTPDNINTNYHNKEPVEGKEYSSTSINYIYLSVYCPIEHI